MSSLGGTMAALRACVAAWALAGAAADRCCGKDGYNSPHGDVALSENGDDLCCREYAAPGRTPLIEQLKCDVLPTETCFANEATGFMDSKDLGWDPGECCAACLATAGCKSWVHQLRLQLLHLEDEFLDRVTPTIHDRVELVFGI